MLQPKPLERKLASHGCKNNNIHDRKQRIHTSKIKIITREIEYTNSQVTPQFFLASSSRSAKSFNPSRLLIHLRDEMDGEDDSGLMEENG
jgi:hypothetical protein